MPYLHCNKFYNTIRKNYRSASANDTTTVCQSNLCRGPISSPESTCILTPLRECENNFRHLYNYSTRILVGQETIKQI